jgi:H+/Cl- antiporter ClcA
LYWGFTNVDEILHTGKSASAPGIWLLAQLASAKVLAMALCKGSGLVGGLYAPSLMIGAAVGAIFGGSAEELINLRFQVTLLLHILSYFLSVSLTLDNSKECANFPYDLGGNGCYAGFSVFCSTDVCAAAL